MLRDLKTRGCDRVNLAFGCTAGKHRSVFVAEALAEWLRATHRGVNVRVQHQDMPAEVPNGAEDRSGSSTVSSASTESCESAHSADAFPESDAMQAEYEPAHAPPPESKWHAGPVLKCTYHPDQNRFEISEHSKCKPCAVVNVLSNGLSNLKSLRLRRAKSGARDEDYLASSGACKVRRMGFDLRAQPHSV
mmetsp:Transcript_13531/g.33132  ORF Transcript_13531/g.33132 Transcript_13531/m.33132 type:complete len:191 (+) Transcript_13531:823-1395(+)